MVQDKTELYLQLQWQTDRKPCMTYGMVLFTVTLNDA